MAELKTGDIVVSSGVGVGGAFMRITDQSIFSHASIIIKDPYIDQPCLWESIGNDESWYPSSLVYMLHVLWATVHVLLEMTLWRPYV